MTLGGLVLLALAATCVLAAVRAAMYAHAARRDAERARDNYLAALADLMERGKR